MATEFTPPQSDSQEYSTTTGRKQRIKWIDTAKGICILLVVLQHISNYLGTTYPLSKDIQTFRMPLYFFLSGLFFKAYSGFGGFIKRKINKLFIPYVFFFVVFSVIVPVSVYHTTGYKIFTDLDYGIEGLFYIFTEKRYCNTSIWFLQCLFEVNILFYLFFLLTKRSERHILYLILLTTLCGVLGVLISIRNANLPFFIDSALSALPFFVSGYLLRNYTNFLERRNTKYSICLDVILIISLFFFIHHHNYGAPSFISNSYGEIRSSLQLYPYGILATLAILSISRIVGKLPILSYIGRYSIIVLCTHPYLYCLIGDAVNNFSFSTYDKLLIIFVLTTMVELLLIPVFRKYLGYFIAQKDLIKV